jgi:hypothetical protein
MTELTRASRSTRLNQRRPREASFCVTSFAISLCYVTLEANLVDIMRCTISSSLTYICCLVTVISWNSAMHKIEAFLEHAGHFLAVSVALEHVVVAASARLRAVDWNPAD